MANPSALPEWVIGVDQPTPSGIRFRRPSSSLRTRICALLVLAAVTAGLTCAVLTAADVLHDSFVAPAILSPESEVVLAQKLRISELDVERARAVAEMEGIDADLSAADQATRRLERLRDQTTAAVSWTAQMTVAKESAGAADLKTLADQKQMLVSMIAEEEELARKARIDMNEGIISRSDLVRENQTRDQLRLALLENDRTRMQSESSYRETQLAEVALSRVGAPLTPELVSREEQLVHVDVEMMRLEAEKRTKVPQRRALEERVATIDELLAQLKAGPFFEAAQRSVDVAFVPYTQMNGVEAGADVYSCLWGIVLCKKVGTVIKLVAGEMILPDPWGVQTRGQYAVLSLQDRDSAKSKLLRVRPNRAAPAPAQTSSR
jgi:hypothetical protein